MAFASCKKPITKPNSGIYRGTFYQIYNNEDTNAQGVAVLALSADGDAGTFNMSGDTSSGAPYTCYGDYSINNATTMTFNNKGIVDVGYQPHYLLDTVYYYTFDNQKFTLDLEIDTARYEYKMIRD